MRKDITVAAEPRLERGKNANRRLRTRQMIPAVVYGTGKESVAVAVSPKEIGRILRSASGHNTIFNLSVGGGETSPVMVVDWQDHPVRGNLLHVDLLRIDLHKRLKVKVPVHTMGDPKGVKQQGGLYEIVTREVEIECLPDEIPEAFTVDVTELMIGEGLRAQDLPLTGSMTLQSAPDTVISHVVAHRGAVEEAPAEAAAAAAPAAPEPEVVKRGRKEEEK
jgi:large subunit ribosomal protein L25